MWPLGLLLNIRDLFGHNIVKFRYIKFLYLKVKWASVLNHIVNKHEWALGQCEHGPIDDVDRDKEWISPRSQAFDSLQKVVLEPRLLKSFPYYITCQYVITCPFNIYEKAKQFFMLF